MGKTKPKSSEKETEDEREGQKCESVSVESSNLTVNSTSENVVNSSESILAAQTLISTKPSDDLKPFFQQMTNQMSEVNANIQKLQETPNLLSKLMNLFPSLHLQIDNQK